jgi:transcriptional regulator with XRE-family HTH domain
MSFVALQERLRKILRKRIEEGEITGMELARRTQFTQAHISNFLNRKRGLKLSALDRMLLAADLELYDLLNPHELARYAAVPAGADEEYADVPLVEGRIAAGREIIVNEEVTEVLKFRRAFLARVRAELATVGEGRGGERESGVGSGEPERRMPALRPGAVWSAQRLAERKEWTRFVLIKVDAKEGMSMWPRLNPGATLLIDRHYNSLRPYRKGDRNLYAVRTEEGCTVKYVELAGDILVLRPHNPDYPVEVLHIEEGRTAAELIVGRVAHVAMET